MRINPAEAGITSPCFFEKKHFWGPIVFNFGKMVRFMEKFTKNMRASGRKRYQNTALSPVKVRK